VIDTQWFLEALRGERVVVRMHTTVRRSGLLLTEAHAFSCWQDDAFYTGFELVYGHDEERDRGLAPLQYRSFPRDPNAWTDHIVHQAAMWPANWDQPHEVVCTVGRTKRSTSVIKPGHLLALSHLARFQAAAETRKEAEWGIELGIVARRLDGLVRSTVKSWRQLVG
jgi:hypothetical protein